MRESVEITLLPHFEPLASENPFKDKYPFLLEHQFETFKSIKDHDIVFNLSTTGTGKTLSALLGLLNFSQTNALIIAPTNALVGQHKRDAADFVEKFNLPHLVEEINAERLSEMEVDYVERKGEKLYRFLSNPASFLEKKAAEKKPLILVTNPDIFYYSIFYLFNVLDKRNVAQEFMTGFNYLVIDELHYYNAKQFANFLYFIVLSYKFGFFEKRNRKIVILTATPDNQFGKLIDRLKALNIRIKEIDPQVSSDKPFMQVLSELKLTLLPLQSTSDFPNHIEAFFDSIKQAIEKDKDGLIISGSLRNINIVTKKLKSTSLRNEYARITGPIPKDEREKASLKSLILATPTVDIGYNFVGIKKDRQNIDFGYFDARFFDQFWQRLGRIGRVLGKSIQNEISCAYAFIPEEAYLLSEQNLTSSNYKRDKFKQHLQSLFEQKGLMERNLNPEYISYFSLLEIMLPLKNIYGIVPEDSKSFVEETFETIRSVYSPGSKKSFWSLLKEIKRFEKIKKVLNDLNTKHPKLDNKECQILLRSLYGKKYIKAKEFIEGGDSDIKNEFIFFLRNQIAKYDPIFKFRGSVIEISVVAYDPYGLISESRNFVPLDFFHLVRNCKFELFKDRIDAINKSGLEPPESQFYVWVEDIYPKPLTVRLSFTLPDSMQFEDFERDLVGSFVSLNKLEIVGVKKDFDGEAIVSLPKAIKRAISEEFITGIILRNDFVPRIIYKCRKEELYPSELEGTSEGKTKTYLFFTGIDAHEFFSKYGWNLKKLNSPTFIV